MTGVGFRQRRDAGRQGPESRIRPWQVLPPSHLGDFFQHIDSSRLAKEFFFLAKDGDDCFQSSASFRTAGDEFVRPPFGRHERAREQAPGIFASGCKSHGISLTGR